MHDGRESTRELDQPGSQGDRTEIRQRERRDADLTPLSRQAHPIEKDAATGERHEREASEPAEEARAAKHGALVEPIDADAVVSAIEVLPHEAEPADVEPVRHHCARLVDDAQAIRTQLMIEEIAAAVAADPCLEGMREEHVAPKGDVV